MRQIFIISKKALEISFSFVSVSLFIPNDIDIDKISDWCIKPFAIERTESMDFKRWFLFLLKLIFGIKFILKQFVMTLEQFFNKCLHVFNIIMKPNLSYKLGLFS